MTEITLRQTKGAPLTHDELDANFANLKETADLAYDAVAGVGGKANAAALGVDDGALDLGTFTGTTISDNTTAKGALQELETALEASGSLIGPGDFTEYSDPWLLSPSMDRAASNLLSTTALTASGTIKPQVVFSATYDGDAAVDLDFIGAPGGSIPLGVYAQHEQTGSSAANNAFTHSIMGYALNNAAGNNDVIAVSGRVRKNDVTDGIGDAAGVWGSAYQYSTKEGLVMAVEASIYQNITGATARDRLGSAGLPASTAFHVGSYSTGSPATAMIAMDGAGFGAWNGVIIDKNSFPDGSVGLAGTVGINCGSWDAGQHPQIGWKVGNAFWHIYRGNAPFVVNASQHITENTAANGPAGYQVKADGTGNAYLDLMTGGIYRGQFFWDGASQRVVAGSVGAYDFALRADEADYIVLEAGGDIRIPAILAKDYPDDAAAASGGVPIEGLYHTSGVVRQRVGSSTDPISFSIASQSEAEGGTENTKVMTSLRVAQAIDAQVDPQITAIQNDLTTIQSNMGGLSYAFDTKANMDAFTTAATNSKATVYSDPDADNNGDYRWDGAAWEYLGFTGLARYFSAGDENSFGATTDDGFALFRADADAGFQIPGGVFNETTLSAFSAIDILGWQLFDIPFEGRDFSEGSSQDDDEAASVSRIWTGGIEDTSVAVAADIGGGGAGVVVCEISTDAFFTNIAAQTGATMPDKTENLVGGYWRSVRFVVAGLEADTHYYGRFKCDGLVSGDVFEFTTAPASGVSAPFKFAVYSCSDIDSATAADVLASVDAAEALFQVSLGDLVYSDISQNDVRLSREVNTRMFRSNSDAQTAISRTPMFYVFDDHDSGPNDGHWDAVYSSGATFPEVCANSRKAWKETVAYNPQHLVQIALGETNPEKIILTQQWDIGKVRFLFLDTRSQARKDVGTVTSLGIGSNPPGSWDQLSWLKGALVEAGTDGMERVMLLSPRGWTYAAAADGWTAAYGAEQTEICDYIRDTPGIPPVLLIVGDNHSFGMDDGANTDFSTGGGLTMPQVQSAGIRQTPSSNSGPFTFEGVDTEYLGNHFALIEVDGADFTVHLYGEPVTDGEATLIASYSSDANDVEVEFADASGSAPASLPTQLPVAKSWIGRAAATVAWASDNGQSGTLVINPNAAETALSVIAPASGSIIITLSSPVNCTLGSQTTYTLTAS